jgi:hypothetical protein
MEPDIGLMTAASDPNWLLSSAAQSAAALVAIVGGFLAARVIAYNSDRDAAVRRNNITDRDLRGWMELEAKAKAELDEWEQKSLGKAPPPQQGGGGIPLGAWSGSDAVREAQAKQERAELERRLSESQERVVRLILEQDQIQRELAAMEFPSDLRFGFVVLVIFALLGVVLPIILMATQPEDVSLPWRIVVVIGFVSGLVGLGIFLDSIIAAAGGDERWSRLRGRWNESPNE